MLWRTECSAGSSHHHLTLKFVLWCFWKTQPSFLLVNVTHVTRLYNWETFLFTGRIHSKLSGKAEIWTQPSSHYDVALTTELAWKKVDTCGIDTLLYCTCKNQLSLYLMPRLITWSINKPRINTLTDLQKGFFMNSYGLIR